MATNETLDFENDQGYEVDYASWENADNKLIDTELNVIWNRIIDGVVVLEKMVVNSDCKKAEDTLLALAQGPISRNSWLFSYRTSNQEAFSKYLNGESRPSWYGSLAPEKKRLYDLGLRYYKDMLRVGEVFDAVSRLLIEVVSGETLRDDYRLLKIKDNLLDKGIDEKFYKTVELDARQVSDRINQSVPDMERIAKNANDFYERNYGRMSDSEFERGYRQARLKDYIEDFRGRNLNQSFGALSDGSFYVAAPVLAMSTVVDGYTNLVAQNENHGDTMKALIDRCNKILTETLLSGEKACTTDACSRLFQGCRQLLSALIGHFEVTVEVLDKYKEANVDSTPYCFMHTLSAYDAIKPRYALKPQKTNPWDRGTAYKDLYIMEAVALTNHCEAFVYKMGRI